MRELNHASKVNIMNCPYTGRKIVSPLDLPTKPTVFADFSTVEKDFTEYIYLCSKFPDFLKTLDELVESETSVFVVSEVERDFAGVAGDIRCCYKLADPMLDLLTAYRARKIELEKLE